MIRINDLKKLGKEIRNREEERINDMEDDAIAMIGNKKYILLKFTSCCTLKLSFVADKDATASCIKMLKIFFRKFQ